MTKTTFIAILVVLFTSTVAICNDFNFAGVKWSDSPNQVREKVINAAIVNPIWVRNGLQFTTSSGDEPMEKPLEAVINRMVDRDKWNKIRDGGSVEYNIQKEVGSFDKIKDISFNAVDGAILESATFCFTYTTDQLLSYNIKLSRKTDYEGFRKTLIKKYGKSTEIGRGYVWEKEGQSLYFFNPTDTVVILYYLNDAKITKHINEIKKLTTEIKSKKIKSESKKTKSLF